MDNAAAKSFAGRRVCGENGALMMESSGKTQVDAFSGLIRGVSQARICELVSPLLESEVPQDVVDAFLLVFHKRNCRGGEGEKDIFLHSFFELLDKFPQTTISLIDERLIQFYGYNKDYLNIWEKACRMLETGKMTEDRFRELTTHIANMFVDVIAADLRCLYSHKPPSLDVEKKMNELDSVHQPYPRGDEPGKVVVSLVAKYIPSEGKHYDQHCYGFHNDEKVSLYDYFAMLVANKFLAGKDCRNPKLRKKFLRKVLAVLRSALNIPEIHMCANEFISINYANVPSRATTIYRKAFLNKDKHGYERSKEYDRIAAAENFREFIEKTPHKVKGGQLTPDELIVKIVRSSSGYDERKLLIAQYESLRLETAVSILKMIFEEASSDKPISTFIPNILPMADVSGSMSGRPMDVAVSLTIFFSNFAHYLIDFLKKIVKLQVDSNMFLDNVVLGRSSLYQSSAALRNLLTNLIDGEIDIKIHSTEFLKQVSQLDKKNYLCNTAISFTEKPRVFDFNDNLPNPLRIKYEDLMEHVGYSTNFKAAMDLVKSICLNSGVIPPTLLAITDGQFDAMNRTPSGKLVSWETSHQILERDWERSGLKLPTMVYWNVRASSPGVQVSANHPGVQMMSGFSPSMMKAIMRGAAYTGEKEITPWETFRSTVDASDYDPVRGVLHRSREGILQHYTISE